MRSGLRASTEDRIAVDDAGGDVEEAADEVEEEGVLREGCMMRWPICKNYIGETKEKMRNKEQNPSSSPQP